MSPPPGVHRGPSTGGWLDRHKPSGRRRSALLVIAVVLLSAVPVLVPVLVMRDGRATSGSPGSRASGGRDELSDGSGVGVGRPAPMYTTPPPYTTPPYTTPPQHTAAATVSPTPTPTPDRPVATVIAPLTPPARSVPRTPPPPAPPTSRPAPRTEAPPATPSPPPPPSGRTGSWVMSGTVGTQPVTIADRSGRGRSATVVGGAAYVAAGGRTALGLDGANDYLVTGTPIVDTSRSYTVAAWVRLDRIPTTYATAVSQDSGADSAFFLQYSPGEQRFAFANPKGQAVEAHPVRVGVLLQLTGVYNASGGTLQLFVNGAAASPIVKSAYSVYGTEPLQFGRARWGGLPVDWWPGAIAKVETYNRALTPAEISYLYRAGI